MNALYEITYYQKPGSGTATVNINAPMDSRRKMFEANARGFARAVQWARDHEGTDEFVGSVRIVAVEHL